jgi:hypothetical protein
MSNNSFSGTIHRCLIEMSRTLGVLNLRTNNLNSKILDAFSDNCSLQILALIKNQLEKVGGLGHWEQHYKKRKKKKEKRRMLDIPNFFPKSWFPNYVSQSHVTYHFRKCATIS